MILITKYKDNQIALVSTPWSGSQVPCEQDVSLDVADGDVVGIQFVKTVLTDEEEQGDLVNQI